MLVNCRYCNKIFDTKQLARHLKAKHNIDYTEYVNKYWGDLPQFQLCEVCKKNVVYRKKTCSDECYKIYQSKLSSGRKLPPRSRNHCQAISKKAKERFENPEDHPRYGAIISEEQRSKQSETNKAKIKKEGHWRTGLKNTLDARANMSISALKRSHQPGYVNPMQGKTHSPETIQKIFTHRKMNSIEKMVADKLKENNIQYYFQYFLSRNGICKSYDFKIKGKPLFIEVDGDYWHGGPGHNYEYFKGVNEVQENDRFKDKLADENGFKVIRIWESELKKNPNLILERLNEY